MPGDVQRSESGEERGIGQETQSRRGGRAKQRGAQSYTKKGELNGVDVAVGEASRRPGDGDTVPIGTLCGCGALKAESQIRGWGRTKKARWWLRRKELTWSSPEEGMALLASGLAEIVEESSTTTTVKVPTAPQSCGAMLG